MCRERMGERKGGRWGVAWCWEGRGAIEIFFGKGLGTPPWGRGAGISGMRSLKIGLAQEREGEP